jgi:hypothetical protein
MRLCWGDRFGEDGQVSVFICDPDRKVIELRGRDQGSIDGVTRYVPSPSADRELGLNLRAKPKVGNRAWAAIPIDRSERRLRVESSQYARVI